MRHEGRNQRDGVRLHCGSRKSVTNHDGEIARSGRGLRQPRRRSLAQPAAGVRLAQKRLPIDGLALDRDGRQPQIGERARELRAVDMGMHRIARQRVREIEREHLPRRQRRAGAAAADARRGAAGKKEPRIVRRRRHGRAASVRDASAINGWSCRTGSSRPA